MSATASPDRGDNGARVTIGDVAERAGVSIATVSRVSSTAATASPRPRSQRSSEVIDDLGYESSLVARSLRSQRTNVIGDPGRPTSSRSAPSC